MLHSGTTHRHNLEADIKVDRVSGVPYHATHNKLHIGFRGPYVVLRPDDRLPAFISTKTATNIGLDLCRAMAPIEDESVTVAPIDDLVVLTINGEKLMLLPDTARQIGGIMLRKAERADEWQRTQVTKGIAK